MAEVALRDFKNKVVGKLELSDAVFDYDASPTLVWEAVKAHLAGQRKGTHATKNRALVAGGGRKPWRQKGTGRARAGTIRSPLWKGGGTVHGPQPRDYTEAFPKKKRRGAVKLALSDKLRNEKLVVTESLDLEAPRTKDFVEIMTGLELGGRLLVIDDRDNRNLYLSARNVPAVQTTATESVNIYDLVNCDQVLISKRAVLKLQEVLER